ncbi:MAG: hypothetical protein FWD46_01395 [Cystobacterineae bacterium]|nr:hypothetical protein [Cystobacterineae bacterium]
MLLFLFALLQTTTPSPPEVSADVLAYQASSEEAWAEGNVEMQVANGRLTAQRLSASQKTGWFSAQGQVVIRWADKAGHWVVLADMVHLHLKSKGGSGAEAEGSTLEGIFSDSYEVEEIFLENGLWIQKQGVEAGVLLNSTADEALKLGKNGLSLRLTHMRQEEGRWELEDFGFAPCDCDTTNPSWHLEAKRGTLDLEAQRASLLSTVTYIGEVPVFWMPWISLPLSSRQTGLLFPMPSISVASGFMAKLPLFITLGPSADLTLTPGWTVGAENAYGVKGPSLGTEFRYAPSENLQGTVAVDWLWDMREQRSPVDAFYTGEEGASKKQRGLRWGARINHRQSIGEYGHMLADIHLASDGYLQRDFETDLILKSVEYARSQLGFSYEGPRIDLLLDFGFLQDVRWGYSLLGDAQLLRPVGGDGQVIDAPRGPNTLQRFPALAMTLREQPLGKGFSWGVQGSFIRLAPWRGQTGDEGPDAREGDDRMWINGRWETLSLECMRRRLYQPSWYDDGLAEACPEEAMRPLWGNKQLQGDGRYQPGEREARDRLGLLPVLKYQKRFLGGGLGIAASLGLREDIWLGEATGRWFSRGYPLLKFQTEGTLAKEVVEGLWHTLTPKAELRWVAAQWGSVPMGYDETDLAIPRGYRGLELGLSLRQSLWRRSPELAEELLSLEVAQAVGVANEPSFRVGDTFLKLSSHWRFLNSNLYACIEPQRGQLSRLGTSLHAQWPEKLGGHIRFDLFRVEGTETSRRGLDMLIGAQPVASKASPNLEMGVWAKLKGFQFRYQMSFLDIYEKFRFAQHLLGVKWTPACNCFGFELYAQQTVVPNKHNDGYTLGMPNFGFSFQLQGLGSWGSGGH